VFDKWTSNSDRRQLMFYRKKPEEGYRIMMIDQADCFCRDKWSFRDDAVIGLSECRAVYSRVKCLQDFEPWYHRLEQKVGLRALQEIASEIPPEWYMHDTAALNRLVFTLDCRRALVRRLLMAALRARSDYFPCVLAGPRLLR
jgi:hypothetical protein